jgi:hypothetical protein
VLYLRIMLNHDGAPVSPMQLVALQCPKGGGTAAYPGCCRREGPLLRAIPYPSPARGLASRAYEIGCPHRCSGGRPERPRRWRPHSARPFRCAHARSQGHKLFRLGCAGMLPRVRRTGASLQVSCKRAFSSMKKYTTRSASVRSAGHPIPARDVQIDVEKRPLCPASQAASLVPPPHVPAPATVRQHAASWCGSVGKERSIPAIV